MKTLSLVFFVLSLTFCYPTQKPEGLQIAFPSEPGHLDPLHLNDLVSQKIARLIHRSLFSSEKKNEEKPWIVSEQVTSKSYGKEIVWELSLDAPPAEDIQFSYQRLIHEKYARKKEYSFLVSVDILNQKTIRLVVQPETSVSEIREKLSLPFASIIGKDSKPSKLVKTYGSYQLVEWKSGESILLKLQKQNVNLPNQIRIRFIPQATTSLFLFRKGLLDAFKLTDFLLQIPERNEWNTITKRGRSVQYVAIQNQNPCFDLPFRKALNFAVDRQTIIERILENNADQTYGPIPLPYINKIWAKTPSEPISYDRKKAEYFLKQSACYPSILNQELEFRMRADDENQTKGRAIVQDLKKIGLKITLKPLEKVTLYKENGEGKGDLTLLTWYADVDSVWNFLDPLFHPYKLGRGGNRAFYANPTLSDLGKEPKTDSQAKKAIETIIQDVPWIFLWSIQESYLVSKDFLLYKEISDFL